MTQVTTPYTQEHIDLPRQPGEPRYRLGLHVYPDPGESAPVVIIFPAMGTPARFYRTLAQRLGQDGVAVIVADLRGQGTSVPSPSRADRYGYHDLADDVGAVLDSLAPRLAGRRYYLLGHSLGGQVASVHLGRRAASGDTSGPAGLILVAVGVPFWRLYGRRRLPIWVVSQGIASVTAIARIWPGWAFGGRTARNVMLDWAYTARRGRFPYMVESTTSPYGVRGSRRRGTAVDLSGAKTPILAISVPRDTFTPRRTLDYLVGMMPDAPLERVHLDGTGLDHFSWVRDPEQVVSLVLPFVS